MNVIIVSPNFPACNVHFCTRLQAAGVNVLGIGDGYYDNFGPELRYGLTEYYHVDDIGDYESVYRACAYYVYRYGRIDRIKSFNPFWLETEAKLRKEYGVPGRQKIAVKKTAQPISYTITALLGEGKGTVASVVLHPEGKDFCVTGNMDSELQKAWKETSVSLGEAHEFFTASFSRKKDGSYQLAECYPAPAPLSADLINYTCDCDVFSLWAQAVTGKPTTRVFDSMYACLTVRTDFTKDYPVLAEIPEEYLVQETPVEQVYANTWGGSVLVYRFPEQAAADCALRAIVPEQPAAMVTEDKPAEQSKGKRQAAKRAPKTAAKREKIPSSKLQTEKTEQVKGQTAGKKEESVKAAPEVKKEPEMLEQPRKGKQEPTSKK